MLVHKPIKLYTTDNWNSQQSSTKYLNVLLKAFLNDLEKKGGGSEDFCLCNNILDADFYILPMNWQYYVDHRLISEAIREVDKAKKNRKSVMVFNTSDYPAKLPFSGVLLFETSGYRSRIKPSQNRIFGLPAFIGDYLTTYCGNTVQSSPLREKPLVGFCGQASQKWNEIMFHQTRQISQSLLFSLGFNKNEPPPFETTKFRGDILRQLEMCPEIETDFVIRKRYRAGYRAPKKDPFHSTRLEFIQNIVDTDYTICIRGAGNFSVRFYEALCLGRIPVFIDTDSILPFEDQISFQDYFIWIDQSEIGKIHEKIVDFHQRHSVSGLSAAQTKCRELWVNYFSSKGYIKNLAITLKQTCFVE